MAGLNTVALTGRLTKDVELRKTASGISYARFTVAVDRMSKEDGADFVTCVAWRQSAEFLSQYASKGQMIGLQGRIKTGSYDDKTTGKKIYTTDIECDRVTILESKKPKADYPSGGNSVYTKDVYTDAEVSANADDDVPF